MNSEILISSSVKKTIKESTELAKKLNTGIEISRIPLYKNAEITEEEVTASIKEQLKDYKGRVTLHAMFSDINISSQDVLIRGIAEKRYYESYRIGRAIGADTILFHTGNKGTMHYGSQESFKKRYISFWKEFIKEFEKDNITAVIENVFEQTPEYCKYLVEGVASESMKLALDTGHVNLYAAGTKVTEWIESYGKNLHHMHIHNNYGKNDDHSNLENGTIDFKEVFDCIDRIGIHPTIVLEMFNEEDIIKSLKYINEYKL